MTTTTKSIHADAIARIATPAFEDGTYDLSTLETVEFSDGYQVTFCQVGDDYSADDYEFLVAMFTEISTDGKVYAGKFDGSAEISFHVKDKNVAIKYAKMFNQVSIWDWKNADEIKTGGTGIR